MRIKNHYIKLYIIIISHENQHQNIGDFFDILTPLKEDDSYS